MTAGAPALWFAGVAGRVFAGQRVVLFPAAAGAGAGGSGGSPLVVVRETWRTTVGETGVTKVAGEPDRYLAGRRLRRGLGLPERVFVKLGTETNPFYADFTSPLYVSSLCSMLRRAHEQGGPQVPVTFTELLPGPEHAWLTDAAGLRYLSDLRLQVRDPESGESS